MTGIATSGRNVLAELDKRVPTSFYWSLTPPWAPPPGPCWRARRRSWTRGVKRALIVVCVFFIFQQITGINVPLYYGPKLLGPLFQSGSSKVASTLAGIEVTAIIAAVNVAATYFAFRWIDRIGKRKLAICGYAGMAVATAVSAPTLMLLTALPRIIVVMIALSASIESFAIGVGGTGCLNQREDIP